MKTKKLSRADRLRQISEIRQLVKICNSLGCEIAVFFGKEMVVLQADNLEAAPMEFASARGRLLATAHDVLDMQFAE